MFDSFKWNNIIGSALMIILGIILIFFPDVSLSILATIIGIAAVCIGIFSIVRYFTIDIKESFYRNDFLEGVILLLLGILILVKPSFFISLIPFVLGIVIMFSGISKLQDGIDAKRIGYPNHRFYIILAIIDIIIGLLILFDPFNFASIIFVIIGIGLVYSGASDLYVTLYLSKKFKDYYNDYNNKGAQQ